MSQRNIHCQAIAAPRLVTGGGGLQLGVSLLIALVLVLVLLITNGGAG